MVHSGNVLVRRCSGIGSFAGGDATGTPTGLGGGVGVGTMSRGEDGTEFSQV